MPLPRLWTTTHTKGPQKVSTRYGVARLPARHITRQPMFLFLTVAGRIQRLTILQSPQLKELDAWQIEGPYLALRIGFPPNLHPTTGDYGYEDVVINLQTRRRLLIRYTDVQSTDYLSGHDLVLSVINTMAAVPVSQVTIYNLYTRQDMLCTLPSQSVGLGIVSHSAIFYQVERGKTRQVLWWALPTTGWHPWTRALPPTPIHLPAMPPSHPSHDAGAS